MSKSKNNPISGIQYFLAGFPLILKKGIRTYVFIPLFINISLFIAAIYFGSLYFNDFIAYLLPESSEDSWLSWFSWLTDMIRGLLWSIFALLALTITFFTFSVLANIVASPFNALLAEAVEFYLRGEIYQAPGGIGHILKTIAPMILAEINKLFYFAKWAIPILILFLIPGLQIAAPVIWMLFGAWMMSLQYLDFPMGNHELLFQQQRQYHAKKRYISLGFGGAVMFATMTPFFNFIVMPIAVAGATKLWAEQMINVTD